MRLAETGNVSAAARHAGRPRSFVYDCRRLFASRFTAASWPRQAALTSMAFNLGAPRLAGFRRMRDAIACDDWQLAATEALDSRWAAQTGRRAQHIAGMLRGGGTSG